MSTDIKARVPKIVHLIQIIDKTTVTIGKKVLLDFTVL